MITIGLYIDKLKQKTKLLVKYLIQFKLKRKLPTNKSKLCGKSEKALPVVSNSTPIYTANNNHIKALITEKTATGKINIAMLATKVSSKIHKPSTYNKAVSDLIHGYNYNKAIEKELQNLKQ